MADHPRSLFQKIASALEFVRFSHTIFALPFALVSMLVAAGGLPSLSVVGLILLCMVSARTAAMAFNRLADWEWDKLNPRTENRSRLVTPATAKAMLIGSLILFALGSWLLNPLCAALCPLAMLLILGYSVTKRFTAYCHLFLGFALGAAPMGAWAAVTGTLAAPAPWLLMLGVLAWVFGFDLIYSTLDAEFDRKAGLHSFPSRYGIPAALRLASVLHALAWGCFILFGLAARLGLPWNLAMVGVAVALVLEQKWSRSNDIGRINAAFFQINAVVSSLLLVAALISLFLWKHS
ncbi:4-hydroxybenzoate polyprenyltransferase [Verrucomicrobium sp. GAS474]|uniref:UbiA-like polyprenyltransferase n=1 Tax=Verrucomicrobium sp. GAS474 TaxID=1882831 RepID=UPI00087B9BFF|nr:UbiA-like polyprenyltransferase [Verrucomicrobium sp. GAS474]SDU28597.1 4-hydroxybenzoate polyprenyltransferase [Verrucomicrobium sp. GAS474]